MSLVTPVTEQPPRVTALGVVWGPRAQSGEGHAGMVTAIFLHFLFLGNTTRVQPASKHCTQDPGMELVGRIARRDRALVSMWQLRNGSIIPTQTLSSPLTLLLWGLAGSEEGQGGSV